MKPTAAYHGLPPSALPSSPLAPRRWRWAGYAGLLGIAAALICQLLVP